MAHATARRGSAAHQAPARRPLPRRVSGPIARPLPAPAAPVRRGSTGAFERLRAVADHRFLDRLLRSRLWIWVIGIGLGGIVAMQVSMLKMNAGISQGVEQASTLERVNADLETEVARLESGERIQATAAKEGMVSPSAGDVGYLTARRGIDAALAATRMQPPSTEARDVMANGGKAIDAPMAAATATTVTPPAIAPAAVATPAATPAVVATPAATPATPAAVTTPVAPTAAGTTSATTPAG